MLWLKKREPYQGEQRIIKKFLWLSKEIDLIVRWLEVAYIKQEYMIGTWYGEFGAEPWPVWVDIEWVEGC